MIKSSESEQARRVNATIRLLKRNSSPPEVLSRLIAKYRVSRRQAYRYLQQAQNARRPLTVPEAKQVFTVKLPISLIRQVRQQARRQGGAISRWVEAALRRSLNRRQSHG